MTITLQNTEKGQCYAVKFDRYRQQVVDKLKALFPSAGGTNKRAHG